MKINYKLIIAIVIIVLMVVTTIYLNNYSQKILKVNLINNTVPSDSLNVHYNIHFKKLWTYDLLILISGLLLMYSIKDKRIE